MNRNIIIIDVDGTLTNNIVWYDCMGRRTKGFHSRDIRAIVELISWGYEVFLLTASTWPGVEEFAERTGAIVATARDKALWCMDHEIRPYIVIADDSPDIELFQLADRMFCPADADPWIKNSIPGMNILNAKGGEGVVAEVVRILRS